MHKEIIILSILIFTSACCLSQNKNKEIIALNVEIFGIRKVPCDTTNTFSITEYYSLVHLKNNQDTTISFMIRDCPWEDNFLTDFASVYFSSGNKGGCEISSIHVVKLLPKQEMIFHGLFTARKYPENYKLRLGFAILNESESYNLINQARKERENLLKTKKIYWSNEFILHDNIGGFQFKE